MSEDIFISKEMIKAGADAYRKCAQKPLGVMVEAVYRAMVNAEQIEMAEINERIVTTTFRNRNKNLVDTVLTDNALLQRLRAKRGAPA